MFEFSLALKYLLPKRKQLSVALISIMAVVVISVIVWLLAVFLSVTEGLEKTWLSKLTSLNSPVRINPTEKYFSSYYYKIDSYSYASNYENKTISEKLLAKSSDPFDPEVDMDVNQILPPSDKKADGSLKDPIKSCFSILSKLRQKYEGFTFQDYEIGGASLRIELLRKGINGQTSQSFLNQVSYVASFSENSPFQSSLLISPSNEDVDLLIKNSLMKEDGTAPIGLITDNFIIKKLTTQPFQWKLQSEMLPKNFSCSAIGYKNQDKSIKNVVIPGSKEEEKSLLSYAFAEKGKLIKNDSGLYFESGKSQELLEEPFITTSFPLELSVSNLNTQESDTLSCEIKTTLNGYHLSGKTPLSNVAVEKFEGKQGSPLSFAFHSLLNKQKTSTKVYGIVVPKSFYEKGARIGDRGTLSYGSLSASSVQEQKLPIYIAGFYDPGIIAIGNNCLLAPKELAHRLAAQTSSYAIEKTQANGIQLWFKNLEQTKEITQFILSEMKKEGIDSYFTVTPFYEYDFAKDILQQFNSDKVLFTLVGIIILTVACCNIISLLNLMVNDKKKEIAILQALGASKKSILMLFSFCGLALGLLSSIIGVAFSYLTLTNINSIISFLTWVQGYNPFGALFYGSTLPSSMSIEAVTKILICTPLLAFVAGLIPALRAMKISPSSTLRSE